MVGFSKALDVEIARLRELDVGALRARWHTVFGRRPPPHLPRHLLFRILAYRVQADHLGDLDPESQRLLDRSETPENVNRRPILTPRIASSENVTKRAAVGRLLRDQH